MDVHSVEPILGSIPVARELNLRALHEAIYERVTGIEPAWPAWKAGALPLSYTRDANLSIGQI